MRVICDVHIAFKIVRFFQSQGIEAFHVNDLPNAWYTSDRDIASFADSNDLVVISKYADFQATHFLKQTPRRLLRIALGNMSTAETMLLLKTYLFVLQQSFSKQICFIEIGKDHCHVVSPE
jgi:predicted nuclease of predicted toxin-antitoxin system